MRLFIGIALNEEEKTYLKKVQDKVKSTSVSGDFTHYNNFHITIKYIGHSTSEDYEDLIDIIEEVSKKFEPFTINIGDIGAFQRKKYSIIWVGITSGYNMLAKLYQKIETRCTLNGFEEEGRKYRPHITLGKKIIFANGHNIVDIPCYSNNVNIDKITLFESKRIDGILTYTPIYSASLSSIKKG